MHYPIRLTMESKIDMREFIYDLWNSVMNMEKNPLRHIPDLITTYGSTSLDGCGASCFPTLVVCGFLV